MAEGIRASPYWPVLRHRILRRLFPGFVLSYVGDGMSLVAVSWLALQLAPPETKATWAAVAIAGPVLAAVIIGFGGPVVVIAIDAAAFAVLASTYLIAVPKAARAPRGARRSSGLAGFAAISRDRGMRGLSILTFGFFFLCGPVLVALPVHVVEVSGDSAGTLAAFWVVFGVGAIVTLSVPLGTLAGGPMITSFGAQPIILGCAGLTLALGSVAAAVAIGRARRRPDGEVAAESRPSAESVTRVDKDIHVRLVRWI